MENSRFKELIEEIRTGDKELAEEFVEKTRLYIVNTVHYFTCDENKAIEIANKIYREILLTKNAIIGENPEVYINNLIEKEILEYFKDVKFSNNTNIEKKYTEEEIHENFEKYYDSPAVEKSIKGILSTLSESERLLFLAKNTFNKSVEDIANTFNLTDLVVISEINSAENKIEETSADFYKKYKVQVDFSKISAMKGIIGKYQNYINVNIESILIGKLKKKVKDIYVDEEDEEKEKKPQDFKDYVEKYLLGKLDSWFRKRLKETVAAGIATLTSTGAAETTVAATTSTSGTVSATIATTKAAATSATVASGSIKVGAVAKIIGGIAVATVVGTGGYIAVNEITTNNEVKKITETTVPIVSSEFGGQDDAIKVYSEDGEKLDVITISYVADEDEFDTKLLAAAKAAATLFSGVNMDYSKQGDKIYITGSVDRNKLNDEAINKIKQLDFITPDLSNLIDFFMNADVEAISEFLGVEATEITSENPE